MRIPRNETTGTQCQSFLTNSEIHEQLDCLLSTTTTSSSTPDWATVNQLLMGFMGLRPSNGATRAEQYASLEDDPMGRLLLTRILSKGPPPALVVVALRIFPGSLDQNPACFLAAAQNSCNDSLKLLGRHASGREHQCPYPWILSDNISTEMVRRVLEAYPEGARLPSPFLSHECPLDCLLFSREFTERRTFDESLWNKFKLLLVAAGCLESPSDDTIVPVHLILKRALSRKDFWKRREQYEHILWLLHHLRLSDRWVFGKQSGDGMFTIHVLLSHKCTADTKNGLVVARALTQLLLEAHPESATVWVNGTLALHMATENGWPCHDLLLAVYPEALNSVDQHTELFPFQVAAQCEIHSFSPTSLDVTYELLRSNPTNLTSMV